MLFYKSNLNNITNIEVDVHGDKYKLIYFKTAQKSNYVEKCWKMMEKNH